MEKREAEKEEAEKKEVEYKKEKRHGGKKRKDKLQVLIVR